MLLGGEVEDRLLLLLSVVVVAWDEAVLEGVVEENNGATVLLAADVSLAKVSALMDSAVAVVGVVRDVSLSIGFSAERRASFPLWAESLDFPLVSSVDFIDMAEFTFIFCLGNSLISSLGFEEGVFETGSAARQAERNAPTRKVTFILLNRWRDLKGWNKVKIRACLMSIGQ